MFIWVSGWIPATQHVRRFLEALQAESHRWGSLRYDTSETSVKPEDGGDEEFMSVVNPDQPLAFSSLRVARIFNGPSNYGSEEGQQAFLRAISRSPVLETLLLRDTRLLDGSILNELPWKQLVYLVIMPHLGTWPVYPTDMRLLLSSCRRLKSFHMLNCSWNHDFKAGYDQASPLYHDVSSLEMFENFDMGVDTTAWSLDQSPNGLNLPGLELLALHRFSLCNNPTRLIKLVEGSSNLTSLSIIDTYFMDITIVRFLRTVGKSLQKLILSGQISEHLFERLASDPRFLSNLEELNLRVHHGITIPSLQPLSSIANAIEARSIRCTDHACKTLKVIDLQVFFDPSQDFLVRRLRSMHSEDLHVNVTIFNHAPYPKHGREDDVRNRTPP
ncbi:hypothetical protein PM082_004422 [Marasmius tenuissimus]|nr:hypothetical protein PM082_004422 [Marasmius tenuissimus]